MRALIPRLDPIFRALGQEPGSEGRRELVVLLGRLPVVVIGVVLLMATPNLGPGHVEVALVVLIAGSLNVLVHLKVLERHGSQLVTLVVVDAVLSCFSVATVPRSAAGISLIGLAAVATSPYQFRPETSRVATALVVAGVGAGYAGGALALWPMWVVLYGLAAVGTLLMFSRLAHNSRRLRARYTSLLAGLDAIIWELDPATLHYTFVSGQVTKLLGYTPEDGVGLAVWDFTDTGEQARLLEVLESQLKPGCRSFDLEYRARAADGRMVDLHDRISVDIDPAMESAVVRGVTVDVSVRRRAEHKMRQFADLVDHIGTALLILELDGDELRIDAANPASELAIGQPIRDMVGRQLSAVMPALTNSSLARDLQDVIRTGEPLNRDSVLLADPTLHQPVFAAHAFVLSEQTLALSLTDVTSASVAAATLRHQALHDELTALPNRSQFRLALEEAIDSRPAAAMLLLDLDQFKEVNDALGHHHGDLLLIEVARRLRAEVHPADLVARLGGDEFAVLLRGECDVETAQKMARDIREALQRPFEIGTVHLQTNASIGIARYPDHAEDAESLTKRADVAMYLAKRTGTGSSLYSPDQDQSSVRKLTLIGELRRGLDQGQFTLHYQPVIDLHTGLCHQAEALVRWHHPDHGLLLPGEFIRLAEVSGMVQPLTRWVLEQAVTEGAAWHKAGYRIGVVVNLSMRNLYEPDLVSFLHDLLDRVHHPSNSLTLELTESDIMDDPHQAAVMLDQLDRLGVGKSIGDFGRGYSSLTYLKDLPLQQLKIDQSFVAGMRRRERDLAIVRSMVELGHSLGLSVVAEGVTDCETLDTLAGLGCDLAQGFVIHKPVTSASLLAWLGGHQGSKTDRPPVRTSPARSPVIDEATDMRSVPPHR